MPVFDFWIGTDGPHTFDDTYLSEDWGHMFEQGNLVPAPMQVANNDPVSGLPLWNPSLPGHFVHKAYVDSLQGSIVASFTDYWMKVEHTKQRLPGPPISHVPVTIADSSDPQCRPVATDPVTGYIHDSLINWTAAGGVEFFYELSDVTDYRSDPVGLYDGYLVGIQDPVPEGQRSVHYVNPADILQASDVSAVGPLKFLVSGTDFAMLSGVAIGGVDYAIAIDPSATTGDVLKTVDGVVTWAAETEGVHPATHALTADTPLNLSQAVEVHGSLASELTIVPGTANQLLSTIDGTPLTVGWIDPSVVYTEPGHTGTVAGSTLINVTSNTASLWGSDTATISLLPGTVGQVLFTRAGPTAQWDTFTAADLPTHTLVSAGGIHTATGLTAGHVLTASSPTAFSFAALSVPPANLTGGTIYQTLAATNTNTWAANSTLLVDTVLGRVGVASATTAIPNTLYTSGNFRSDQSTFSCFATGSSIDPVTTNITVNPLPTAGWATSNSGGSACTVTFTTASNVPEMQLSGITLATNYPRIQDTAFAATITGNVTISFEAYSASAGSQLRFSLYEGGSTRYNYNFTLTTGWVRYTATVNTAYALSRPYFTPLTVDTFHIRRIQVENLAQGTAFYPGTRPAGSAIFAQDVQLLHGSIKPSAVDFTATGQLCYYDGTKLLGLGVGTSTYVLASQGAGSPPHWIAQDTGLTLSDATPETVTTAAGTAGTAEDVSRSDHVHQFSLAGYSKYALLRQNAANNALEWLAKGTENQVLTMRSDGAADFSPQWYTHPAGVTTFLGLSDVDPTVANYTGKAGYLIRVESGGSPDELVFSAPADLGITDGSSSMLAVANGTGALVSAATVGIVAGAAGKLIGSLGAGPTANWYSLAEMSIQPYHANLASVALLDWSSGVQYVTMTNEGVFTLTTPSFLTGTPSALTVETASSTLLQLSGTPGTALLQATGVGIKPYTAVANKHKILASIDQVVGWYAPDAVITVSEPVAVAYVSWSDATLTFNKVTLTSSTDVTGILPVANGGTGVGATWTTNQVIYAPTGGTAFAGVTANSAADLKALTQISSGAPSWATVVTSVAGTAPIAASRVASTGAVTVSHNNSGVSADTYGSAVKPVTITVNATGHVTSLVTGSTCLTANQTITLSGEATGSGATSIAVTLTNSAVIGKVLTGLSTATATAVIATDTILVAIGKLEARVGAFSTSNHPALTIGTANGLSLAGDGSTQILSLAAATAAVPGALTAANWTLFNSKLSTVTDDLTDRFAHYFYAGPTSGAAADAAFRLMVASDLPASGTATGTWGTSWQVPSITVDTYGRITSVGHTAIDLANVITGVLRISAGGTNNGTWTGATNGGVIVYSSTEPKLTTLPFAPSGYLLRGAGTGVNPTWSSLDTVLNVSTNGFVKRTGPNTYAIDSTTGVIHAAVTLSGSYDYITLSGQDIVRGQIDLSTDVTSRLTLANLPRGATSGQVLTAQGASVDPIWTTPHPAVGFTGENYLTFTAGTQALVANPVTLSGTNVTGLLPTTKGGSNYDLSATAHGSLLYFYNSGGTVRFASVPPGTAGYKLVAYGGNQPPLWAVDTSHAAASLTGQNYITLNAGTQAFTVGQVTLSGTHVTGTLPYDKGGTGQNSWTKGDLLYASNTNTLAKLGVGTDGEYLKLVSGLPSWEPVTPTGTNVTWYQAACEGYPSGAVAVTATLGNDDIWGTTTNAYINMPCPLCIPGTVITSVKFVFRLTGSASLAKTQLYKSNIASPGTVTALKALSLNSIGGGTLTNIASNYYYKVESSAPLPYTIVSGDKIWAVPGIEPVGGASEASFVGIEWTFSTVHY